MNASGMELINFSSYRSDLKEGNSSDSDSSDSETNEDVWKRSAAKNSSTWSTISPSENSGPNASSTENLCDTQTSSMDKKKRNTVWCNVLQERSVAEDMTQIGLKNKPIFLHDRSCENYDYTLKYQDPRETEESEMEDGVLSDSESNMNLAGTSSTSELLNILQLKKIELKQIELRKRKKDIIAAAKKIVKVLNEPKRNLIVKVVEVLGCEKAMEILKETEAIEENGGMFVKDNSRRRTPGGTYLMIVRQDKSISKKKKNEIFSEDRKMNGKMFKHRKHLNHIGKMFTGFKLPPEASQSGQTKNFKQGSLEQPTNVTENLSMEISAPNELPTSKNEDSDIEEGEIVE